MKKPTFEVSHQVQHKPGSTAPGDGQRLEILDLGSRAVTAPLFLQLLKAGFLMMGHI